MSTIERMIVKAGANLLSKKIAYRLARGVLATQGIGWAGPSGGLADSGESEFVRKYISNKNNPVVFDVGANVGDYSQACFLANPAVDLHCFEPSSAHFTALENRMSEIGVVNAILNCFGLSDVECEMQLNKESIITGMASLNIRDLDHINIHQTIKEKVLLKTGDSYVDEKRIDRIDLLKMDVEGWEMSVLSGFKKSFDRKIIKAVQFEFGHAHVERRENFRDFYRFFKKLKFSMGPLKPNGEVNFSSDYDEMLENYLATNFVAVA